LVWICSSDAAAAEKVDYALAFFMSCYHLADWLWKSGMSKQAAFRPTDGGPLDVCRGICRGAKHLILDPEHDKHPQGAASYRITVKSVDGALAATSSTGYSGSNPQWQSWDDLPMGCMVEVDGQYADLLRLASHCLRAWESFLVAHGLIPSQSC
jgi:hypothetical protein